MVFRTNVPVVGEVWWLQQNFGIFSTRKGAGIWYFHAAVRNSARHRLLSDVFGRTSCPRPWSDKGLKPLVQHWKPWKPLNGHGNFAFYHPFLNYNMLHHVGSVQALKAFLNCSRVEGPTFPLSATIPWSSEQTCKFSARFDVCNRSLAAFWHGRELESDTSMRKSNHPVKTLNFGMSSDSLWWFCQEQAARGPGLTKDWSPWRSIENPENCWTAMVTSPFIIHFWIITCYIMLVGSVQALKTFLNCSRVEGPTFPLSATIPWSSEQMGSNRPGLVAATEFGHLFDTARNRKLILPCGSQIIQWRHYTSACRRILSHVFWKSKLPAALVWQRIEALGAALKTLKTVERPWRLSLLSSIFEV